MHRPASTGSPRECAGPRDRLSKEPRVRGGLRVACQLSEARRAGDRRHEANRTNSAGALQSERLNAFGAFIDQRANETEADHYDDVVAGARIALAIEWSESRHIVPRLDTRANPAHAMSPPTLTYAARLCVASTSSLR